MQKNIDSKKGCPGKRKRCHGHNWMPIKHGTTMAPKKTQGFVIKIQRQQVRDPRNFKFDYMKKQICNVVCFNPFKPFFFQRD